MDKFLKGDYEIPMISRLTGSKELCEGMKYIRGSRLDRHCCCTEISDSLDVERRIATNAEREKSI